MLMLILEFEFDRLDERVDDTFARITSCHSLTVLPCERCVVSVEWLYFHGSSSPPSLASNKIFASNSRNLSLVSTLLTCARS